MYNLAEQKLLKTLMPGIRWISCMDVHPSGDHLIVGGYDRKLCWFDLELSDKPYKILRWVSRFCPEGCGLEVVADADAPCRQVPHTRASRRTLPSDVPAVRILVRRRLDPNFPCARVQRPHDEPTHRPAQDLARAHHQGGPRRPSGALVPPAAVARQRGRGWRGRGVV